MLKLRSWSFVVLATLVLGLTNLTGADAPALKSHEVHPDGRITFRYRDRRAEVVGLNLEGFDKPLPMERGGDGVWSATSPALPPQIYFYSFVADGEARLDPHNHVQKPNLTPAWRGNLVTVPGATPQPWELADIPHGTVHHHVYTTRFVAGLAADQSDYFVYTPPGYDPQSARRYPVLYLLHGWSDLAVGWTEVGKAHLIIDALIAQGRAQPMVVVMPLGYGDMAFVRNEAAWDDLPLRARHYRKFEQALLQEVMPQVDAAYAVERSRGSRAIAGLSMGGRESLEVGLNHLEVFGWVGGFSASLEGMDFARDFAALAAKRTTMHLVWVGCGVRDESVTEQRKFVAWLGQQRIPVTAIESSGAHTYLEWRNYLVQFAPLLFRP